MTDSNTNPTQTPDETHPKTKPRRSIIISILLGSFIILVIGANNFLDDNVYSYPMRFPDDGEVYLDNNNNIVIGPLGDWKKTTQYSFIAQYKFREFDFTVFVLVYPIIKMHSRHLSFKNNAAGQSITLTSSQIKNLRRQISIAYLNKGDALSAEKTLLPDQNTYQINWLGLAGNIFWLIASSFFVWLVFEPIRLAIRRKKMESQRARAILANHCPNCGYDTRNLPQPRCPECGETWENGEIN